MSKIERAMEIMKSNPTMPKNEMVELFMVELSMGKANANGYFVSATKKLGNPKPARVKKATSEKKVSAAVLEKADKKAKKEAANEQAKADRLKQMKAVSERMKKIDGEREQMYADLEDYANEAEAYVREHAPAFLRKELNLL